MTCMDPDILSQVLESTQVLRQREKVLKQRVKITCIDPDILSRSLSIS